MLNYLENQNYKIQVIFFILLFQLFTKCDFFVRILNIKSLSINFSVKLIYSFLENFSKLLLYVIKIYLEFNKTDEVNNIFNQIEKDSIQYYQ